MPTLAIPFENNLISRLCGAGSGHQKAVWTHPIQSEKPKETRVMAGFFVRQRPKAAY